MSKKKESVVYLENFPIENAGYQYRAKKWCDILNNNGYQSKVKTVIKSREKFESLLNNHFQCFLIRNMLVRFIQIIISIKYKTVIVRRELLLYNDYGNLFMEKLLFSLHKKGNIILDFDDDIAFSKNENRKISLFGRFLLEKPDKFTKSLQLYIKFVVCSDYLKSYINSKNNKNNKIVIIPTCVDNMSFLKKYKKDKNIITLGWIGGNENQKYLDDVIEDLNYVNEQYNMELIVVSGKEYNNKNANFIIKNYKWTIRKQYDYIRMFDIGIMPLRNTDEDKGKCGFKLLQYMSVGIVSLASPITINKEIIDNGKNGFLTETNFKKTLFNVISYKNKWEQIGLKAYQTIRDNYTFEAQKENYIKFVN